jgi:hypothetical protein
VVYNVFVLSHLFNEFNCRRIANDEFWVFDRLFNNWLFVIIMAMQFGTQYLFIQFPLFQKFLGTTELSGTTWGACVMIASTVWMVAPILKALPAKFTEKIPVLVDETKGCEDDKAMQLFNKASKGGVPLKLGGETDGPL